MSRETLRKEIQTLEKLAFEHMQNNKPKLAINEFQKLLELIKKTKGDDHFDYGNTLANIAQVYLNVQDYENAFLYYEEGFAIINKKTRRNDPIRINTLYYFGRLCSKLEKFVAAEELFLELRNTLQEIDYGTEQQMYFDCLSHLGTVYRITGNYSKAEYYQSTIIKSLKNIPDAKISYVSALQNLAQTQMDNNELDKAEKNYLDVIELLNDHLINNKELKIITFNNLGEMYRRSDKFSMAIPFFQKVLEEIDDMGKNSVDYAVYYSGALHNLALSRGGVGDTSKEVESMFIKSRDIIKKYLGELNEKFIAGTCCLAQLYLQRNEIQKGMELLLQNNELVDNYIAKIFSFSAEHQRVSNLQRMDGYDWIFISAALQFLPNSAKFIEEIFNLNLRRKGIILDSLIAERNLIKAKNSQTKAEFTAYNDLMDSMSKLAVSLIDGRYLDAKKEEISILNLQIEETFSKLSRKLTQIEKPKLFDCTLADVRTKIPNGTLLIEFIRFHNVVTAKKIEILGPKYLALIVDSKSKIHCVDIGDATTIDDLIGQYRKSIQNDAVSNQNTIGKKLKTMIFDPLGPYLGHYKKIIIATSGELNHIPFEVLPIDDKSYLIDIYEFSYVSTSRDFMKFKNKLKNSTKPLIIAHPDYNLGMNLLSNPPFTELTGTKLEGESIADMLDADLFVGKEANERQVKDHKSPKILHLASHGFFIPRVDSNHSNLKTLKNDLRNLQTLANPLLRSGIALGGANASCSGVKIWSDSEDGILTGEDVTSCDFSGTDLVVLSACETGVGEMHRSEGIMGLRRAIQQVGAQSIVMSLWQVNDDSTKKLMVLFYQNLLSGKSRSESLRNAQLELRREYPDPYFWGAFICLGNPNKISFSN